MDRPDSMDKQFFTTTKTTMTQVNMKMIDELNQSSRERLFL